MKAVSSLKKLTMHTLPILFCCLSLLASAGLHDLGPAPVSALFDERDVAIFAEKQKLAAAGGNAVQTLVIAKSFLGTPYAVGTLEQSGPEQLVINLRELDCWTFVETSLGITLSAKDDFQNYKGALQQLRYWGGTVNGYGSRIHYFSGWVLQAQARGLLRDLTAELGGIPYRKKIGYISAHPDKYPRTRDAATLRAIVAAEARISRHDWFYVPKSKVAQVESQLREGDIILLTSAKPDLDIAHQGFAIRQNGRIHLLHASSLSKRVVISAEPLPGYMAGQKGQSGMMVVRINP